MKEGGEVFLPLFFVYIFPNPCTSNLHSFIFFLHLPWTCRPTSLDAKAFGYLALQLYPEIPNPRFQMILTSQFPRLVAYCDRCKDEFFANLPDSALPTESSPFFTNPISSPKEWFRNTFLSGSKSVSSTTTAEKPKKTQEERDFDLKRIYAVTFGLVAMVAYVIVNGIVVVSTTGDEEEEEQGGYFMAGGNGVDDDNDIHVPSDD